MQHGHMIVKFPLMLWTNKWTPVQYSLAYIINHIQVGAAVTVIPIKYKQFLKFRNENRLKLHCLSEALPVVVKCQIMYIIYM